MTEDVEDLKGSRAVDDDVAIADEGEVIAHVAEGVVGIEHQLEPRRIVGGFGFEGVAWRLQGVWISRRNG